MIQFRCPECGKVTDVYKHVDDVTRVYVDNVGYGLKLYESELTTYKVIHYECG